jgi:hypothetical protein
MGFQVPRIIETVYPAYMASTRSPRFTIPDAKILPNSPHSSRTLEKGLEIERGEEKKRKEKKKEILPKTRRFTPSF